MSDFAKNNDDLENPTEENLCEGFHACPEGAQMPMTAAWFNGVFAWLCAQLDALKDCIDKLSGENIGSGEGLFSDRLDKTFRFKSIVAGKGVQTDSSATELTISSTSICCYSEASVPAGPPPAGFIASMLVDDCTDPGAPFTYVWSCKAMAYFPLVSGATNMPPECLVHAAQTATAGTAFSYDASGSDPDGDTLTYTATGTWPAGFVIDGSSGIISAPASFTAPDGMYVLNWTIDDGNNPPVDCALSLTVEAILSASGNGGCAQTDNALPEPSVWCGVGSISGVQIGGGFGSITGQVCGLQVQQIIVQSNPFSPAMGLIIQFDNVIPATMSNITVSNGVQSYLIDLTPFAGSSSVSTTVTPTEAFQISDIIDGSFTITGAC